MILIFVWLPPLSMTLSRSVHVAANGILSFFLRLSNIPLYICTTPALAHSSADGHLGCFHVLAIVNSAAVNTGVHISFWIVVLSGYIPRSGTAIDNTEFVHFSRLGIYSMPPLRLCLDAEWFMWILKTWNINHTGKNGLIKYQTRWKLFPKWTDNQYCWLIV